MSNLQVNVAFRSSEVQIELESNMIAVSESKQALATKNIINRLKANKAFTSASIASLELIVKHSNAQTLDYLLNASNYKTASRILDAAKMLNQEKHSTILDYTLTALNKSMLQKTSVNELCVKSSQCYARISNAVKALAFFNVITVDNVTLSNNIISKMSKDTLVSINK
jgi:hypothetical protein